MTTQLEKVFTELQQLPEAEQNAVAQLIEDELLWDLTFQNSASLLEKLANEALEEHRAGLTKPIN